MEVKKGSASDRMELRSEKVRNIIGTIPPALVCWSIVVIAIIFVGLLLVLFFVPYPYEEGETFFQHWFLS
ncbi:hypothetical protein M3090_05845 [Bacteroides sp. ET71]|uniref:hypothetical protein n=1 Tax=Bacteroides sp. ET71 TaxID=2939421 RepID=UPI0020110D86|nr:hypothetical protein [Bacteroides sp. ET71]MCL1615917.1 hypothetical protein [Bacteroides sp. ET71]